MGFWQYGLQGDNSFPASGGLTYPYSNIPDMQSCKTVTTLSLNSGVLPGNSYRVLLNTFSLGTQLYVEFTPTQTSAIVITPVDIGRRDSIRHVGRLFLRDKSGNEITLSQFGDSKFEYFTDSIGPFPGFSLYYYNYMTYGGYFPMTPPFSYPRSRSSGGLTHEVAMTSDDNGVNFYIVGYPSYFEVNETRYNYNAPCQYIGSISRTYLENAALFDAAADSYDPASEDNTPGGGIPGLPTSPDYPGIDIDFPPLPAGANAFAFSKLKLFKPSASQLSDALDILYTDSTDSTVEQILESAKKWWYKPEQYCISLMLSPVDANTSASEHIKFGKYDSEVFSDVVSSQWQIVDLGICDVPLKYGSFLDFSPYANAKIYLPYIGFRSLNINEIMGSTIACKYYVDMLTGASLCMIKIKKVSSNDVITYTYECNTSFQVPLTSNNYSNMINSLISAGVSAGMKNWGAMASQSVAGISGLGSGDLTESGKLTSNSGVLGVEYPFIVLEFPVPSSPNRYTELKGSPSDMYISLSSLSGYVEVESIELNIPGATEEELNDIRSYLENGCII